MRHLGEYLSAGLTVQDVADLLHTTKKAVLELAGNGTALDPVHADYLELVLLQRAQKSQANDRLLPPRNRLLSKEELMAHAGIAFRSCTKPINILVAFVDLDNFKEINDQHGHLIGDEVIAAFSEKILSCRRVDDLAARFGGDEFVVLMQSGPAPERQKKSLLKRLANPLPAGLKVEASIGFHEGMVNPSNWLLDLLDCINKADQAMYIEKHERRKINA